MFQDLGYSLRTLSRNPGLVAAAVICLALGIGANATIFGVVDTLLLKAPPHIKDPGSVVRLYFRRHSGSFGAMTSSTTGYPLYAHIRDSVHAFDAVAALTFSRRASLGRGAEARPIALVLASASYFPLLGVRPALGRFYGSDEDRVGGPSVAVLGHGLWRAAFGGDSAVLGRRLQLGRGSYEVVGVAPARFTGVNLQNVDVWVPIAASTTELEGPGAMDRGSYYLQIIGRLGASGRGAAQREATVVYRADDEYSGRDSTAVVLLGPVQHARGPEISQNAQVSLWLAAVSVIVLLVACANVANLLLARSLGRQREMAIRLALGSGWGRLTRQTLTESVVLALAGGIAALLVTLWAGSLIRSLLLPSIPAASGAVDARVLGFTAALAILTGLLAGLAPAWQLRRQDLTPALKTGGGDGRTQGWRLRALLLVGQVALTVVLLVGAGLFVRSLRNVEGQDFGFDPAHTLVATMDLRAAGYEAAEMNALQLRMLERLEALPAVEAAAATVGHPFGWATACDVSVPGRDSVERAMESPYCQQVTPGYFAAMGTPVQGRAFTPADHGMPVAIVNRTMARILWPGENAVGKCLTRGDARCYEVVGVVPDARRFNAVEDASLLFYVPFRDDTDTFITALVLRVRDRPDAWVAPIRTVMQETAADLPYARVTPLADLLAPSLRPWRLASTMFGGFALLALVLAAVGLYGVLAYGVTQRTHEMGVRMAMGARRWDVQRLMVAQGVGVAAIGALLGGLVALIVGRVLSSLLYGVSARDPLVLVAAVLMPVAVATVASYIPARRAARVDPVTALRYE